MEIGYSIDENLDPQLSVRSFILVPSRYILMLVKVYVEAQKLPKAMKAHERALEWRELFTIASILEVPEEEIVDIGYRMAGTIL